MTRRTVEKYLSFCPDRAHDVNNKPCVVGTGHTDINDGVDSADRVYDAVIVFRVHHVVISVCGNLAIAPNVRNDANCADRTENANSENNVSNADRPVCAISADCEDSINDEKNLAYVDDAGTVHHANSLRRTNETSPEYTQIARTGWIA